MLFWIPCAVWVLVLSCGTCTAFACSTDTLRIQAIRLKSWILDLRLSGKQIICLCHEVIHDRASGVLRVVWVRAQLWSPVQRVWETQDRFGIVWSGDSSEEVRIWLSQIENYGSIEQEIRNKNFGSRNGNFEKNAVVKNQGTKQRVQRILGDCWQWETNGQCVSATMRISVEKVHHQIRLRILSCCRMSENHREPEVPEAEVPVVERLDGLARITLEELAITHFVKNGTLQNACSTRPRVVVGLGKSAHSHIVRLMNSRQKRSKKNDDKSAVAMLKKGDWHERGPVTDQGHDRSGKPEKRSDKKLERRSSQRRSSDARQLGCVF